MNQLLQNHCLGGAPSLYTSSLTFCIRPFVTGPAKIDHVSKNYTKVYFANIICSEFSILFLLAGEESPLFNSAVVMKILLR